MKSQKVSKLHQYRRFLDNPAASYLMILGTVGALAGLGLVMVLSASSVASLEQFGSAYTIFLKQTLFLVIGLLLCGWGTRLKSNAWDFLIRFSLVGGGLALVLPIMIGKNINGNKNWIGFGSFLIQPSEFAKLALIFYIATQFCRHEKRLSEGRKSSLIGVVIPGTVLYLGLILAGKDLGTAIIVAGIVVGLLFIAGVDLKNLFSAVIVLSASALFLAINQPSRMHRFRAVLDPFAPAVYKFSGWQPAHSLMSLASGGLFGVGIGASKQKWANLSEAHTDFIFSVIGEEVGLLGTLSIVVLYGILIFAIFRIAITTKDSFAKYAVSGIGCWLIFQVLVNLLTDVGLVPVIGVTLPFISYGGSSLIANFIAISFVLNVARRESELKAMLANRKRSK